MKTLHAKSPCCRAKVQRFGERRRRCKNCLRTWCIYQKKRGRKQKRVDRHLAISYLNKDISSIRSLARRRGCDKNAIQVMLRRSLEVYMRRKNNSWQEVFKYNNTKLIAVADAIWHQIKKEYYTIYIILLRPVKENKAVICQPIVVRGREDLEGWEKAFDALPIAIKARIIALVCDGAHSLVNLAKSRRWLLQRCHFHLIASVQNYLSTGPRGARREYAQYVLKTVQQLLHTNNSKEVCKLRYRIYTIRQNSRSCGMRRVLGGLLTNYKDYHTYLYHPHLNLPTTTNSAESFIQCVRDLMYRCRGFRSQSSLTTWLNAFSLFKKTIRCAGKKSTK